VSRLSDDENWSRVKDTLLQNTGMAGVPVIRIIDADYQRSRMLYLEHEHDGRDLQTEYRQHTMKYLYHLWGRKVVLATRMQEQPISFALERMELKRGTRPTSQGSLRNVNTRDQCNFCKAFEANP
jgi:spore cortex formation protein SpoVR/YcgB (stage V sporulation)